MIRIFIICSLLSISFSKEQIFWDLGVIIKDSNNQQNQSIIKPLISNTQISPMYKDKKDKNLLDLATTNLFPDHIIKLLYISERYFELTQYVENLDLTNFFLKDDDILIYSDALYRLGNYDKAIINLNQLSSNYPNDEKYFILALCNKKLGKINNMTMLLDELITNHPNSEYIKLAKLQSRIFN